LSISNLTVHFSAHLNFGCVLKSHNFLWQNLYSAEGLGQLKGRQNEQETGPAECENWQFFALKSAVTVTLEY
jgi:hypothetical protein